MELCKKKRSTPEELSDTGECWVWVSFIPQHRLFLATTVGTRTQAFANRLVEKTFARLEDPLPLFISDGIGCYGKALLEELFREEAKIPFSSLRYGQVVKERRKGRVVSVNRCVIFGDPEKIPPSQISTHYLERQNLSLRTDNRRLTRKTIAFSKKREDLKNQIIFYVACFNFVRPHRSLRKRINEQVSGKTWRYWQKRTPAMSIGITDHIWSLRELLTYRVPLCSTA